MPTLPPGAVLVVAAGLIVPPSRRWPVAPRDPPPDAALPTWRHRVVSRVGTTTTSPDAATVCADERTPGPLVGVGRFANDRDGRLTNQVEGAFVARPILIPGLVCLPGVLNGIGTTWGDRATGG